MPGCTDPDAENFFNKANQDDGSCVFVGCTESYSSTFSPRATVDDGSCETVFFGCMDNEAANFLPDFNYDDGSCRIPGCMDRDATNFNVKATFDDQTCVAFDASSTGRRDRRQLADRLEGRRLQSSGCMDPTSSSFDPDATTNDNSQCTYEHMGCQDQTAKTFAPFASFAKPETCRYSSPGCAISTGTTNFDPDANEQELGSCNFVRQGCMDRDAFNYVPEATMPLPPYRCFHAKLGCPVETAKNYKKETTVYHGCDWTIKGCADKRAMNYAADVNHPVHGSCIYEDSGCMIRSASNFKAAATKDDGSCFMMSPPPSPPTPSPPPLATAKVDGALDTLSLPADQRALYDSMTDAEKAAFAAMSAAERLAFMLMSPEKRAELLCLMGVTSACPVAKDGSSGSGMVVIGAAGGGAAVLLILAIIVGVRCMRRRAEESADKYEKDFKKGKAKVPSPPESEASFSKEDYKLPTGGLSLPSPRVPGINTKASRAMPAEVAYPMNSMSAMADDYNPLSPGGPLAAYTSADESRSASKRPMGRSVTPPLAQLVEDAGLDISSSLQAQSYSPLGERVQEMDVNIAREQSPFSLRNMSPLSVGGRSGEASPLGQRLGSISPFSMRPGSKSPSGSRPRSRPRTPAMDELPLVLEEDKDEPKFTVAPDPTSGETMFHL